MDFEFSWLWYFVSLGALMMVSIALTTLCGIKPGAGADQGTGSSNTKAPASGADNKHDEDTGGPDGAGRPV